MMWDRMKPWDRMVFMVAMGLLLFLYGIGFLLAVFTTA